MADTDAGGIKDFTDGVIETSSVKDFTVISVRQGGHGSVWKQFKRYASYFLVPLRAFFHRKEYRYILGWQQFYTNIFAFYCKLFHVKKTQTVISLNFTYKAKSGIIGKLYKWFMLYSINSPYIDYLHVPSSNYADRCVRELGVPREKFVVTTFGVSDTWKECKTLEAPMREYALSIGRSNRDFDFLVEVYSQEILKNQKLVLISDMYKPKEPLPDNILWLNNVKGAASKPWMVHADFMILPIEDGNIASGDTVLLTSMSFEKTVVITRPSTLAEMYIEDGVDGIAMEKDVVRFAEKIHELATNESLRNEIGRRARKSYLEKFSLNSMGKQIGKFVR